MIEWAEIFVVVCLILFAGIALFVLRFWIYTFFNSCFYNVRALFPQHIHSEIKKSTTDVLVIFNDVAFPKFNLAPLIKYFENGVELYYVSINYNLPLTAHGHAMEALGSVVESKGLLHHFNQNPALRYTFLGLGVGGFIAAFCAQRMPVTTNVYLSNNFQKNRVRTLLVGTPIGGCRFFYNFAIAPFTYKPELCSLLEKNSDENEDFWDTVDVLHHVFMLHSKNDIRCSRTQQKPPPLFTRYIETKTIKGTPWYGLLTEANSKEAMTYLWDFTHL